MRRMHSLRTSPGQLAEAHTRSAARAARSLCSLRSEIDLSLADRHSTVVGSAATEGRGTARNAAPAATNGAARRMQFIGSSSKAFGLEMLFALRVEVEIGIAAGFGLCRGARCRGRLFGKS